MSRRLILSSFGFGVVIKSLLMLLWKIFHAPQLLSIIFTWDPLPFAMASKLSSLLFDQRRVAPTEGESITFVVALVVGCGLEFAAVGSLGLLFRNATAPKS